MTSKTPVLLVTVIRSAKQQWFVAGIAPDGDVTALVCSEVGNLDAYVGRSLDEQVSFLRHRLCGAFQRGFDRLWERQMKTQHIVVVLEGDLPDGDPILPQAIAEHFQLWMTQPEATTFATAQLSPDDQISDYKRLAGELADRDAEALQGGWHELVEAMDQPDLWETIAKPVR